jgi:hypothetical protein
MFGFSHEAAVIMLAMTSDASCILFPISSGSKFSPVLEELGMVSSYVFSLVAAPSPCPSLFPLSSSMSMSLLGLRSIGSSSPEYYFDFPL